jgi:peptidoglycan/LPS O-acetylase OafA/YrhL
VGVDIFFVISGFVMAQSIGSAGAAPTPGRFLLRRALRILPFFWILTAGTVAAEYLAHRAAPDPLGLLSALTIVPLVDVATFDRHPAPIYVSWTLAFEAIFYLLVALALRMRPGRPVPALLAWTLAAAACGMVVRSQSGPFAFVANPIFAEFALGIVGWMIWRNGKAVPFAKLLVPAAILMFAAGLALDFGQGFNISPIHVIRGETSIIRTLVWGVPALLLIVGLASERRDDTPLLRACGRIGDASYAIYLVHPQIISLVTDLAPHTITDDVRWMTVVVAMLALVAGLLLHEGVESPLLARLTRHAPTRPMRLMAA